MTDDFDAAVLTAKNDRENVPTKLRARQSSEWDDIAGRAEAGMRLIEREMVLLRPPDAAELDDAYRRLRALHSEAFGWNAPDVPGLERLGTTRMRQYVRAWINEWDLVRLDPAFRPRDRGRPGRVPVRRATRARGRRAGVSGIFGVAPSLSYPPRPPRPRGSTPSL